MPGTLLDMENHITLPPKEPEYGFILSHQKVSFEVDFSTQTLKGRTEITIIPTTKHLRTIRIDARQCKIDVGDVTVNGNLADHEYEDPSKALRIPDYILWDVEQHDQQMDRLVPLVSDTRGDGALIIPLPSRVRVEEVDIFSEILAAQQVPQIKAETPDEHVLSAVTPAPKTAGVDQAGPKYLPLTIGINFSTTRFREGLHFVGFNGNDDRYPHLYTRHSIDPGMACAIFPCVDDPDMRCTWEVAVTTYRTLGDAMKPRSKPHHKKVHTNGATNGTVIDEEPEVSLSDSEKLLELAVVCSGEIMNEINDPSDSLKKIVSFSCSSLVAAQHIGFAIGPFEQVDLTEFREDEDGEKLGQGQALPLFAYCLPGRSAEVRHVCLPMAHCLDWFMLNFGAYPFADYNMVFVDDLVTDTEHTASLSICSNRLLFGPDIIDPEIENTTTLVHAIASQWMGVFIVPEKRVDRWLTIGLSHFMTGLFMKSICGNNDYMFRQKVLSDKLVKLDIERPSIHALGEFLHLGAAEMDFMKLKAPLVLFILDKRLMKASGLAGVARVISKIVTQANIGPSSDSIISTEGFCKICEKQTKYRAAEVFFNQWVLGAGCPKFRIGQKFNKKKLAVEMTINQIQEPYTPGMKLQKEEFQREFKEDINRVWALETQRVFTGPMTIRIHEADGTPYEHIVEIREGQSKFDIPYSTKYKRLKRSRRQKERLNAGVMDREADGADDALYYCLGDVLQTQVEAREWDLHDWDQDTEARMDAESYEWIRIDADFEWICAKEFVSMPSYMYVSQLQQDRDVVAQQESLVYLSNMPPHPLVSTFFTRTLMDTRYFHGIRTLAAEYLTTHASVTAHWAGWKHLEKAYSEFFCYPNSMTPKTNNFADRRSYKVELAIPRAMSKIRDVDGKCTKNARHFILDQLRFNDNGSNEYSDNFKVANLLSCLADSLIPRLDIENALNDGDDEDIDPEPLEFQQKVIDELDRHRRMDEWIDSYNNIFTITVLEAKLKLMKAKVIPIQPTEFAQYLHDGTAENVRIKAFEALVELDFMTNEYILKLLLNVLSTDPSPYVRIKLGEKFYVGLAMIAFAEGKEPVASADVPKELNALEGNENGEPADQGGLVVVDEVAMVDADELKAYHARSTTIEGALAALKEDLEENETLRDAIWEAIKSDVLGCDEQADLLDICAIIFDTFESMKIKLKLPHYWRVKNLGRGRVLFGKTDKVRTKPLESTMKKIRLQFQPVAAIPPPYQAPYQSPGPTAPIKMQISIPRPSPKPSPAPGPLTPAPKSGILRLSIGSGSAPTSHSTSGIASASVPVPLSTPASASASRAMKPPKRPADQMSSIEVQPRRKILKLSINTEKVEAIHRQPARPTIQPIRKSATPRESPAPTKPSPAPKASPDILASPGPSTMSASPAMAPSPASANTLGASTKVRKPLPDTRKPLPDAAPKPKIESSPPAPSTGKIKLMFKKRPSPAT